MQERTRPTVLGFNDTSILVGHFVSFEIRSGRGIIKGRVKGNEYTFKRDDSIKYLYLLSEMGLALKGRNLLPLKRIQI